MRSLRKRWLLMIPVVILIVFAAGFLFWALYIPPPMEEALAASISGREVEVTNDEWLVFRPRHVEVRFGVIFYPGARVDHRAYSPAMKSIAERGYLVVVPSMPLNMALFAPERAADIEKAFPEIKKWVIAGHSMGGAFAAQYADRHRDSVKGLILWAAYPSGSARLANSDIPVLSVYGTSDAIATPDEVLDGRSLLPIRAEFAAIIGGNHAQFGWYGNQSGDGQSKISREDQQAQIIEISASFLEKIQ